MKHFVFGLLISLLAMESVKAQGEKPKHLYGHDVKVRAVGELNFKADTPKVAVEFFHDPVGKALLAISDSGNIAVVPFPKLNAVKSSEWAFAHELRVRKSTEETFSKDTKKYSIEAYKDLASGMILYVSDQKSIALGSTPKKLNEGADPAFHHGLTFKVRGVMEQNFANAKAIGVDVSKDGNAGDLIYVSEGGQIAVGRAPAAPPGANPKRPRSLHGLSIKSRKSNEGDFTPKTRVYSAEVFEDPNANLLVFICETGSLSVVPYGGSVKMNQGLLWSHALTLGARKPGEKDFEKAAKYGVEAFIDQNSGTMIYISETGSIAALPVQK